MKSKFKTSDRVMVNTHKYDVIPHDIEFGNIGIIEGFSGKHIVVNFNNNTVGYYYEEDLIIDPSFNTPLDKALNENT